MPDPFVVPCPPWCRRGDGHQLVPAARGVDGAVRRVHLGELTAAGTELEQFETVDAAGQVTRGQLSVCGPHGRVPADGLAEVLGALDAAAVPA